MREALDELVPHFEKQSGHKVVVNLYPAATLVIKVKEGAPADIVMTTPDNLAALIELPSIWSKARVSISRMRERRRCRERAGAPKPDIGTPRRSEDRVPRGQVDRHQPRAERRASAQRDGRRSASPIR